MRKEFKIIAFLMAFLIALFALVPSTVVLADDEEESSSSAAQLTTLRPTMELKLEVGGSYNASSNLPEGFGGNVHFSSDNPSVASVNPETGIVSAVKEGTATVRASNSVNVQYFYFKVSAKKTTTTTTTTKPQPVTKNATILGTLSLTVEKGKTVALSHAGLTGNITYRSGNAQIVTVSKSGVVKGVKVGKTYVQAFNNTHVYNYEITVTESENETVTVTETTTKSGESETVTLAEILETEPEERTTFPEITVSASVGSSDNGSLKTRILIITAIIIVLIIVAAILIYKFVASRGDDDYPVDFYPDEDPDSYPSDDPDSYEEGVLPEYNFTDESPDDYNKTEPVDDADEPTFINENADDSDDDFLL